MKAHRTWVVQDGFMETHLGSFIKAWSVISSSGLAPQMFVLAGPLKESSIFRHIVHQDSRVILLTVLSVEFGV